MEPQFESDTSSQQNKENIVISNCEEFLKFCRTNKKIKVMNECNPLFPHIYLIDISLQYKGPLQDKMYSKKSLFYHNIRRGNTLCQTYDENNKPKQLFFCRRGMKKFYDMQPDYLKDNTNIDRKHQLFRKMIFRNLDPNLQNLQSKFHLYSIFKQNGQHCQISYIRILQCWVFCSKNVAILARNKKDLQQNYSKKRFYWAKLVGHQFLVEIQQLNQHQRQNLIIDLQGHTLLGEHCGNQEHQHIIKYNKVQIIFYALVNNIGQVHCQPVESCIQFLKKYHFRMPKMKFIKDLRGRNAVYGEIESLMKEVAEGTMDLFGQGSVVYVVQEYKQKQKTITMFKLKTTQYLIFRKLRQMLKINVSKKGNTANTFEKFKFEIQKMIESYYKPPKSLNFYYKIGQLAFKQVYTNVDQITTSYLRYKFVQFIKKMDLNQQIIKQNNQLLQRVIVVYLPILQNFIEKYCRQKNILIQHMYRVNQKDKLSKNTIHLMHMIPKFTTSLPKNCHLIICEYTNEQINQKIKQIELCKDITKSNLISFIKSQDKSKTISLLNNKIQSFKNFCKQNKIKYQLCQCRNKSKQIIQILNKIFINSNEIIQQKNIEFYKYIILPLTIPGSGKTRLKNKLFHFGKENKYIDISSINSDQMRRQLMNQKGIVNTNDENSNKLYLQTKQQALIYYKQAINTLLKKQTINKNQIIYLDRCYCPTTLISNLIQINAMNLPHIKLIVLMQQYCPIKLNGHTYPYCLQYLLNCLLRCLERQQHQTLQTKPYEIAKVILKFYQMYRDYSQHNLTKKLQDRNIKCKFLQYRFVTHHKNEQIFINEKLKKILEQCLRMITPGMEPKDCQCFIQLIDIVYQCYSKSEQQDISASEIIDKILEKQ